ncbi:MAG: hypothetical protein ACYCSF_10195 [Acidimicrobiales bacterium]
MRDVKHKAQGTRTEVTELVGMVKSYALQETVGPLKQIGRALAFGSAAALMFGIAAVLFLVGLLRVLQTETGSLFGGEWTWVPYLLTIIAAVVFLGVAAALALRPPRTGQP